MYDNLAKDKKKVDIFVEKQLPKAIKGFKDMRRFPNCICYEYTIPATRNQYVIYFYAESSNQANAPTIGFFFYIYDNTQRFVVKWGASPYKHTECGEMMLLRQLHVYTYHFLQRYNERYLKKDSISANEIASIFLARNLIATPIEVNKEINRNTGCYGKGNAAFKIRDGFCFAQRNIQGDFDPNGNREKDKVHAACFVYTTFLSSSEMSNLQEEAINVQNNEAWKRFREDFSQRKLALTLEPWSNKETSSIVIKI